MINNNEQLFSWIISIYIGFIYSFLLKYFYLLTRNKRKIYKILLSFIFILLVTIFIIYVYYKINGGIIHYSYILFWILGYYMFFIVKSHVNRHKK